MGSSTFWILERRDSDRWRLDTRPIPGLRYDTFHLEEYVQSETSHEAQLELYWVDTIVSQLREQWLPEDLSTEVESEISSWVRHSIEELSPAPTGFCWVSLASLVAYDWHGHISNQEEIIVLNAWLEDLATFDPPEAYRIVYWRIPK